MLILVKWRDAHVRKIFSDASHSIQMSLVCIAGMLLSISAVTPAVAQKPASERSQVLKAEQISREQANSLPDHQVIEIKGSRVTAGELRARMARTQDDINAKMAVATRKAGDDFENYRHQYVQEQQRRLETQNAQVRNQLAQVHGPAASGREAQIDAVRREARQLVERIRTASPAERAHLEQRAGQLMGQLDRLGVASLLSGSGLGTLGKSPSPQSGTPGENPETPARFPSGGGKASEDDLNDLEIQRRKLRGAHPGAPPTSPPIPVHRPMPR